MNTTQAVLPAWMASTWTS